MSRSSRRERIRPSGSTSPLPRSGIDASDSAGMREALVPLLLITAAAVLVYSNTFGASFHLDDIPNIVENDGLRDLRLQWPPSGSRWLGYFSFALNCRRGGLGVFGCDAVIVVVDACYGGLVLWLALVTRRPP